MKHVEPHRTAISNNRAGGAPGSVLLVVLWWLLILSVMAIALQSYVRPRLALAARLRDSSSLHYCATAALRLAMAVVAEDENPAVDALNDNWSANEAAFRDIELGENVTFSLGYRQGEDVHGEPRIYYGMSDEERRLNLNRAPREVLERMFEQIAGLSPLQAGPLAAAVIDWRDADDRPEKYGAEDIWYRSLDPPYRCKNAPFQAVEELNLIKGMNESVYRRIAAFVTVWGTGAVNVNTASPEVLSCTGLGPRVVRAIRRYRAGPDGRDGTADDVPLESVADMVKAITAAAGLSNDDEREFRQVVSSGMLTVRSDNFRGQVWRQLDNRGSGVHITFVFNRNGVIRYWQEF